MRAVIILSALLLSGCASSDDAGRFVGTVVGAGIKAGFSDGNDRERDRVVVIERQESEWCSYWRHGYRRVYRC